MNCFSSILKTIRRQQNDAHFSLSEVMTSRFHTLFHHLSGSTTKGSSNSTMGNNTSQEPQGATSKKGFLWSSGPQPAAIHEPPDFLVKLAKVLVMKSLSEDHLDGITQSVFLKYVCNTNEPLGKRLFHYIVTHWQGNEPSLTPSSSSSQTEGKEKEGYREKKKGGEEFPQLLSKSAFLAGASHIISLVTDAEQMEFYIKVFSNDVDKIRRCDVEELVFAAYHSCAATHKMCCLPDDILAAVVSGAMHGKESVSGKYLQGWFCQHCPRLVMWLHRSLTHTLTVGHRTITDNTQEDQDDRDTPILDCPSKSSCVNLHPALIWLLTCSLPRLYTRPVQQNRTVEPQPPSPTHLLLDPHVFIEKMISAVSPTHWLPLYNSDTHGLSINRLQHHVFGYQSATLTFLTAEGGNLFVLACDQAWRDSQHFWGGDHCLCIHLTPEYRIIEAGPKIAYFNVSSRGYPTGLQVGSDYTNRALTLDLNLSLLTYRRIPLRLQSIEVWGCGTVEAKNAQADLKKREVRDTENRRKVKVNASDWLDNPDRYLIEMAGTRLSYAQYETHTPGGASGTGS